MKKVTYEDWKKNPTPRMMWVWNSNVEDKVQAKVISVVKTDACVHPVLSIMNDDVGYDTFRHCAEIEEPKARRMTKAKEIIKNLVDTLEVIDGEQIRELKVVKEAEQFIKEVTDE